MALLVLPTDSKTTSVNPHQTTTTFTEAPVKTDSVLETDESAYQTSFQLTTSEMSYTGRVTDDGNGTATIQDKSETRLFIIIILCLIASYSSSYIS